MQAIDIIQALGRERHDELRAEAARGRLLTRARPARPGLIDRFLASLGGLLISTGERLRARAVGSGGYVA